MGNHPKEDDSGKDVVTIAEIYLNRHVILLERKKILSAEDFEALLSTFGDHNQALIVPHNDPDPDAIAAAVAMRHLLMVKLNITAEIAYKGIIGRAENKALVRYLGPRLRHLHAADLTGNLPIALVDTQPGAGNNPFSKGEQVFVVIDHHTRQEASAHAHFADVRTEVGATSTILTGYLRAAGVEPPVEVATALFYGISTDTMGLARGAHPDDIEAYLYLQPRIDVNALAQIENAQVPVAYFQSFAAAYTAARLYDDVLIAYLGKLRYPDLGAELADLFQRLQGITWVICMGVYGSNLHLSVRSRSKRVGAGKMVRAIVGERGVAGGHGALAGGQIPLKKGEDPAGLANWLVREALKFLKGEAVLEGKALV